MKSIKITSALFLAFVLPIFAIAQVGIGTDTVDVAAQLELNSTSKGLMLPKVALEAVDNTTAPIEAPSNGLIVYNTSTTDYDNGIVSGFNVFSGTSNEWSASVDNEDVRQVILRAKIPVLVFSGRQTIQSSLTTRLVYQSTVYDQIFVDLDNGYNATDNFYYFQKDGIYSTEVSCYLSSPSAAGGSARVRATGDAFTASEFTSLGRFNDIDKRVSIIISKTAALTSGKRLNVESSFTVDFFVENCKLNIYRYE